MYFPVTFSTAGLSPLNVTIVPPVTPTLISLIDDSGRPSWAASVGQQVQVLEVDEMLVTEEVENMDEHTYETYL